ncbi:hypothetical protein CJ030_MR2G012829 [Morella rubra]|uniref:DUF6821 domain-containing protein n=1 Tax=Morella rubra TaxID=262757 RepID=A0A6A1W7F6_9ROSI|nr:hypothetical protein CJ030_MR2G012829 [Morella rubra]
MDLDEWEYLPDDGFLDFHEVGEKRIYWSKRKSDPKAVFETDYFLCPSPTSRKTIDPPGDSRLPSPLVTVPVPVHWEPMGGGTGKAQDDEPVMAITKVPLEIGVAGSTAVPENTKAPSTGAMEADQDTVSQVFFKIKENEFVDMKMDSPKSGSRGFIPQSDAFQFEDKDEALESITSPRMKGEKELVMSKKSNVDVDCNSDKEEVNWEQNSGRLNIWKWSLTGVGAICSFGVAAATVCVLYFGSHQRNKQHQQNQKLRFQIYADDKRIKQVVHQASKLNEAISAARGVPMARAQVTLGGYYDNL